MTAGFRAGSKVGDYVLSFKLFGGPAQKMFGTAEPVPVLPAGFAMSAQPTASVTASVDSILTGQSTDRNFPAQPQRTEPAHVEHHVAVNIASNRHTSREPTDAVFADLEESIDDSLESHLESHLESWE